MEDSAEENARTGVRLDQRISFKKKGGTLVGSPP